MLRGPLFGRVSRNSWEWRAWGSRGGGQALVQVIDEAQRLHAAGLGIDEAVQQARFGDLETWTLRASQGPTAIRRVYLELNGELNQ